MRGYTVNCVTLSTQHLFPHHLIPDSHKLRQKTLNEKLGWGLPSWKTGPNDDDVEQFDLYDNRATVYFIVTDDRTQEVVGVTRMHPTTLDVGYMLKNAFAHAVESIPMPCSDRIWETSIASIPDDLSPDPVEAKQLKSAIFRLFLPAYQEFALNNKIEEIIGLAIPKIWERWTQCGIPHEAVGRPVKASDGTYPYAAKMPISMAWLQNAKETAGIQGAVLYYGFEETNLNNQYKLERVAV